MTRTCDGCRYLKKVVPEIAEAHCTRNPPHLEITVMPENRRMLSSWYPPQPRIACGEYRRRWPWTRP